jgi:DNA invertase Pin-like site-specific DNA recombinase
VSTTRQQISGLGLDAQKMAVKSYVSSVGGTLIAEYEEIQSGGNKDKISVNMETDINKLLRKRPILKAVLNQARQENAIIVVKESSRLTRYPFLMEYIINLNIRFVAVDNPKDDVLLLRIKTALNAEELVRISSRTRAALAAKRAAGYCHQPPNNFTVESSRKGVETRRQYIKEDRKRNNLITLVELLNRNGKNLVQIADILNDKGYTSVRGNKINPMQVSRLLK